MDTKRNFNQTLKALQLVALFILLSFRGFSGVPLAQEKQVSLKMSGVALTEVLKAIEQQTDYMFVFTSRDVKTVKNLNVECDRTPIEKVLRNCLVGTNLEYKCNNRIIVIQKKDEKKIARISATVVDENRKPLVGATVLIMGSDYGVVTDKDGRFTLSVTEPEKAVLHISFIGMKDVRYPCRKLVGTENLIIKMSEDTEVMDEVVITGYQTLRKNELTGAIQTIKAKDLMEPHVFTADQMLQGKIPGLNVINLSSTPGVNSKIRIRGESSITGNREPLWVVDGRILEEPVNVSAAELNSLDRVNFIANAISFINPEDIERIDILQDASATAIYGVKAANGVIVVTTKRGESGPVRVGYSASFSFQRRPTYDDMRLMNSAQRTEVSEEMVERGLHYNTKTPTIVGYEEALQKLWSHELSEEEFRQEVKRIKERNFDWYDLLMKNKINHRHTLSLSGGNRNLRYRVSLGYTDNGDAVKTVGSKTYTLATALDFNLRDNLKVNFNMNAGMADMDRPHPTINLLNYAYRASRVISAFNDDNSLYFYNAKYSFQPDFEAANKPITYNVLNELEHTGNDQSRNNLAASLSLKWDILPNLRVQGDYSYGITGINEERWTDSKSFAAQKERYLPWDVPFPKTEFAMDDYSESYCALPYGGIYDHMESTGKRYSLRHTLNWTKTFKERHNLAVYMGTETSCYKVSGVRQTRRGYLRDRGKKFVDVNLRLWPLYSKIVGSEVPVITDRKDFNLSAFATFAYTYDNRYIINANVRTDGSNQFGRAKKYRFLPVWSVSARWNLYNEKFIRQLEFVDDFSLRCSYGWQGNVHPDQVPYIIARQGSMDPKSEEFYSTVKNFPNSKLRWEKTRSWDVGMSFSLFNNLVNMNFDYYVRKGKDQVISQMVPLSNGQQMISLNGGDIENRGWSIGLNLTPVQTDNFTWTLGFTTSRNRNKVTNAGDRNDAWNNYLDGSLVRNGASVNTFYSYRFTGLDEKGLPTFAGIQQVDQETGEALVKTREEALNVALVESGKRVAPLTGGIHTGLLYKAFSLNASFTLNIGNKIRLNPMYRGATNSLPQPFENMPVDFVDRWRKPGDEAHTNVPGLSNYHGKISEYDMIYPVCEGLWQMYDNADIRVVSGNYLKCNSISLSYMFPQALARKLRVGNLNVGIAVARPFTIKSKDLKGRDPEQMDLSSGAMPQLRSYSLSLSVSF